MGKIKTGDLTAKYAKGAKARKSLKHGGIEEAEDREKLPRIGADERGLLGSGAQPPSAAFIFPRCDAMAFSMY
ncbi:MAG: hypothetical protein LAO76_16410 [Acidobacteriia bacterium]|nr:hypothetical protein [Terriglobia bacterium]